MKKNSFSKKAEKTRMSLSCPRQKYIKGEMGWPLTTGFDAAWGNGRSAHY